MLPQDRLRHITERFEMLEARLNDGPEVHEIAEISREYAEIKPVAAQITAYKQLCDDMIEAESMLTAPDFRTLAEEELPRLKSALSAA